MAVHPSPSPISWNGAYLLNTSREGKAIDPSLITGVDPANLQTGANTQVTVTFEREGAANHNLVGVYALKPDGSIDGTSVKFIWLDANQVNQNVLGSALVPDILGNAQPGTVVLDNFAAGTKLGFFLVDLDHLKQGQSNADVAVIKAAVGVPQLDYAKDMDTLNSKVSIDANHHVVVDGHVLQSNVLFTSNPAWNVDQVQHTISGVNDSVPGQLIIGFEDRVEPQSKNDFPSDHDYNDVVFAVHLSEKVSEQHEQVTSPTVQLADSSNDIALMTIDTTGFQVGDQLSNLASANGFTVVSNQSGNDYHVSITETTGHTTAEWQSFINSVGFSSSSTKDGVRDISYTVTDSAGHTGSTTAHIDASQSEPSSTHTESLSQQADILNHSGTTELWGSANDTLKLDQHFTGSDGKLDMGAGDNTLQVGAAGFNITNTDTSHLANVDHIDMTGFGINTTMLKAADVVSMTDSSHILRFDGDAGDTVTLTGDGAGHPGHWTAGADTNIGGANYHQYEWHHDATNTVSAVVQINEHLTQSVTD